MSGSASSVSGRESPKYVFIEKRKNYAIVTMKREPVNSMNLDLWSGLLTALQELEADQKMRGVIFTSGLARNVFTAGNDINELYSPNSSYDRYSRFWRAQTTFLARLYASRLLSMAVIPGQCPAGGCVLALVCDVRFMANDGDYRIGLNEVALGIPVPLFWAKLLILTVGHAVGEEMLYNAGMVSTTDAQRHGLVHFALPKAELMSAAEQQMEKRLKFADGGRVATKAQIRAEFARQWEDHIQEEIDGGWAGLTSPAITAALGAVLEKLQGGAPNKDKPKPKAKL